MSEELIQKIRKGRQVHVKFGDYTLICRRPTDMEMMEMRGGRMTQRQLIKSFVEGWEGVKECDVVPGGGGDLVTFTPELFSEWIEDRPHIWKPISKAVVDAYKAHEQSLENLAKN